jgi:hypothetical protein
MVALRRRPPAFTSFRFYPRHAEKPPLKLIAELRKITEVSITKRCEAARRVENDLSAAFNWLQNDLAVSGAKKAAHRTAGTSDHRVSCDIGWLNGATQAPEDVHSNRSQALWIGTKYLRIVRRVCQCRTLKACSPFRHDQVDCHYIQ